MSSRPWGGHGPGRAASHPPAPRATSTARLRTVPTASSSSISVLWIRDDIAAVFMCRSLLGPIPT